MAYELELIHWLQSFRNTVMDLFFQFWTLFGEELIIIAILGFLYWCYDKKVGEKVGITVFVSLVFNSIIKVLIMRPRPFVVDSTITNIRPSTAPGYAFPSGHTQGAATTFGSLAIWLKKKWVTIASIVIITFVAISRMYLGAHYLSDVVVGALLGIIIAYGFYIYSKKHEDSSEIYKLILIGSIVIFVLGYIYYLFTADATQSETNALVLYNNLEGVSKMIGAIVGFVVGLQFEQKIVRFSNHKIVWRNGLRFIGGILVVMAVRLILKAVFGLVIDPDNLAEGQLFQSSVAILFDFLRYFAMVFIGIGIYPLVFKEMNI
ncbi:MAG: phosphatase PAP2 family protein [Candidatus Izemoplasmatales bacterium]|nr:phosphatase PAP2 family protein [Candidatus Izemoplasmatales bacterium]